jgi:hypothetical protein
MLAANTRTSITSVALGAAFLVVVANDYCPAGSAQYGLCSLEQIGTVISITGPGCDPPLCSCRIEKTPIWGECGSGGCDGLACLFNPNGESIKSIVWLIGWNDKDPPNPPVCEVIDWYITTQPGGCHCAI